MGTVTHLGWSTSYDDIPQPTSVVMGKNLRPPPKPAEAARAAFESAWSVFLSKRIEADFQEYRRHRASTAWKYAMWDAGCKLPSKPRCFLWHRYPDRGYQHISSHEPEAADHFLSRSRGDRLRSDR